MCYYIDVSVRQPNCKHFYTEQDFNQVNGALSAYLSLYSQFYLSVYQYWIKINKWNLLLHKSAHVLEVMGVNGFQTAPSK